MDPLVRVSDSLTLGWVVDDTSPAASKKRTARDTAGGCGLGIGGGRLGIGVGVGGGGLELAVFKGPYVPSALVPCGTATPTDCPRG